MTEIWEWITENWSGILATCAVILTITEIRFTRRHNKLSVKPHLGTFSSTTTEDGVLRYTFFLNNDGLGPAEIDNFRVFFNKRLLVENNVIDTQEKVGEKISEHFQCRYYVAAYTKGAVIPAGEKTPLLTIYIVVDENFNASHFRNFLDMFDLKIDYMSFYGTKFYLDTSKMSHSDLEI